MKLLNHIEKRTVFALTVFSFLFCYASFLTAQEIDSSMLSVDRIFSSGEFRMGWPGRFEWLGEGDQYTQLDPSESGRFVRDLVRYDVESGEKTVLLEGKNLIPEGSDKPIRIEGYDFSPDQSKLLIFTNSKRVWRRNTRGDYYIYEFKSKKLYKLGGDAVPSTLMFATFSPDGNKAAYVREQNLYVEDWENNVITPLTTSGSETIINGTFDWVYEEELGLRNGFRWSPDGKRIAYWQLDASGIGVFNMINNTDSIYSRIIPVQYPKVGTQNSAGKIGVVSSSGGETTWFDVPGDPRNHYIARMNWAESSDEIIIQQLNRLQNTNKVMLGNATTGAMNTIYTDNDSAWVEVVDDLKWLNGGKEFTWVSEQDGWRHVYRISRNGKKSKLITPGDYDVMSVVNIDEKSGWLYFMASPDNATQEFLYRTKLNGKGKQERLTPKNMGGMHRYNLSPNSKWASHSYSSFNTPSTTEIISLPDHKTIRVNEDNKELKEKLAQLKLGNSEFFQIEIEPGVSLDGFMIKPWNFDPAKKYPVLFYIYGEPAGQTVLDRFSGSNYLWHQMLTQQGYIIMSVDNRGTPGPKGREWRKCIYGQIGILASEDQAAALRKINEWSFVDSTRIGIWGWSGGGTMSLNCIFRYPDLYQTAMAVAFVADQKLYDTIYQERYMGLPSTNPEGYKNGSPVNFAHQLKGHLLLVHGTGDDNVHYQNTELLINELIRQNKMVTVMPYPNRSHGIFEGENTTRHLYETLTRFLNTNLPAGPK